MVILKEAWKPTSRAGYAAKWELLVDYSLPKQIDPPSQSSSSKHYLLHMQKSSLAYPSVRLQLAAVAAYLQNRQHIPHFRVPVIKAFMEGLKLVISPQLTPPHHPPNRVEP